MGSPGANVKSGSLGVLGFTDELAGGELVGFVQRLEAQGYESFWVPEIYGREALSTCGYLLAATSRIRIATGIATAYARDAVALENARRNLAEFSDGRFELGLGVSHANLNEPRGHTWIPPVRKLRSYLDAMEAAPADGPAPNQPAPVVIASENEPVSTTVRNSSMVSRRSIPAATVRQMIFAKIAKVF